MATAATFISEEDFQCSLCLDVFTNPVSTPCGHTFCQTCIGRYWDSSEPSQCPLCLELFDQRPSLHTNTIIADMTERFKREILQQSGGPLDVPCDFCATKKLKAHKSCLVCLVSYCQTHLEPHQRVETLKGHKLVEPVKNLEERMCRKHGRPLDMFCRREQTCVCVLCSQTEHRAHYTIPADQEWKEKKVELQKTEADVQQMILERQQKVGEIRQSMVLSKTSTEKQVDRSVQIYCSLLQSIEQSQAELTTALEEKQRATMKRAQALIKDLEQEIAELQCRNTELEKLSHTEDHVHFLQSFPSISVPPQTRDWADVTVHPELSVGITGNIYEDLGETLSTIINNQLQIELKKMRKYAVDVTLDPRTAHPSLVISKNRKQVQDGDKVQDVEDTPQRFDSCLCVLGSQGLGPGRHYWEVQVGDKANWDLGVVRQSVSRQGQLVAFPENGYWTVWLRNGCEYTANASPPVALSLRHRARTVGVYVDYEEGQVSFYNVDDCLHMCTFSGYAFREKLFPIFSPHINDGKKNAAPLIISSLSNTQ